MSTVTAFLLYREKHYLCSGLLVDSPLERTFWMVPILNSLIFPNNFRKFSLIFKTSPWVAVHFFFNKQLEWGPALKVASIFFCSLLLKITIVYCILLLLLKNLSPGCLLKEKKCIFLAGITHTVLRSLSIPPYMPLRDVSD